MDGKNEEKQLGFSVDAGLIDRLGKELVGRAETAVSELVKNAYDADATEVYVTFINAETVGGSLIIEDNGVGMNDSQLELGFMRISSTDKLHNPVSERYHRTKAGRKGIGRFATQRLGEKLTITTQTIASELAIVIEIDWTRYKIDQDITSISFPTKHVNKEKAEGTTLRIDGLKEGWSEPSIKRIYRYVSELLQPNYLSDRSRENRTATQKEQSFDVIFQRKTGNNTEVVASEKKMLFDNSLATIIGGVDNNGVGFCEIRSDSLSLDDFISIKPKEHDHYRFLKDMRFSITYFIYNRHEYYKGKISKLELRNIQNIAENNSGIRLYRNGFRVLPYGEFLDDWIGIDKRWAAKSGVNVPFANRNLFGYVEIIDREGVLYEETASREGLIETEAFSELKEFLNIALTSIQNRLTSALIEPKKARQNNANVAAKRSATEIIKGIKDKVSQRAEENNSEDRDKKEEGNKATDNNDIVPDLEELEIILQDNIDEVNMLRVLSAMGLTIGEFSHEVIQFTPDLNSYLSGLYEQKDLTANSRELIGKLDFDIRNLLAYTAFFNTVISENVSRETMPVSVRSTVHEFVKIIQPNLDKVKIRVDIQFYGYNLYTVPMHISEWISILYNLYTNAKKAIKRAKNDGAIYIVGGEEKGMIYLEFSDNGDGIPPENRERIFDAFFTTSTPAGFTAPIDEQLLGTGLGLKIVKDIVESHKGNIYLIDPETNYKTCFRIEIPKATNEQIQSYGV